MADIQAAEAEVVALRSRSATWRIAETANGEMTPEEYEILFGSAPPEAPAPTPPPPPVAGRPAAMPPAHFPQHDAPPPPPVISTPQDAPRPPLPPVPQVDIRPQLTKALPPPPAAPSAGAVLLARVGRRAIKEAKAHPVVASVLALALIGAPFSGGFDDKPTEQISTAAQLEEPVDTTTTTAAPTTTTTPATTTINQAAQDREILLLAWRLTVADALPNALGMSDEEAEATIGSVCDVAEQATSGVEFVLAMKLVADGSFTDEQVGSLAGASLEAGCANELTRLGITETTAAPTITATTTEAPTTTAASTTVAPTTAAPDCHPNYEPCVPFFPGDALNCGDITFSVRIVGGADPYGFDGTDNDGLGCESN